MKKLEIKRKKEPCHKSRNQHFLKHIYHWFHLNYWPQFLQFSNSLKFPHQLSDLYFLRLIPDTIHRHPRISMKMIQRYPCQLNELIMAESENMLLSNAENPFSNWKLAINLPWNIAKKNEYLKKFSNWFD